ncbi:calcium-binding protein [Jannaschia rubra]|uniref:Cyclolysin n=1 Tax=Jannaschia rubra TaxID=282197 RepID=A0A0M6XRE4_9RHOB|nr:calcium-binding protein [Jannaschia rubra]CTQ33197.1 Cyclolysin [Jannaschia rubra]SFF96748.1 Hemolysin-type calcium-binding repeat-containing protein [Jannaschia rubra]
MAFLIHRGQLAPATDTTGSGIVDLQIHRQGGEIFLQSLSLVDHGIQTHGLDDDVLGRDVDFRDMPRWLSSFGMKGMASVTVQGTSYVFIDSTWTDDLITFDVGDGGHLGRWGVLENAAAFDGPLTGAATARTAGEQFVYVSQRGVAGLTGFHIGDDLELRQAGAVTGDMPGGDVLDMTSVDVGGATFLLAAVNGTNAVMAFGVGTDGALTETDRHGHDDGLGLSIPTVLRTAVVGGVTHVLVGGAGSSSISVMQLDADGTLTPTEHLLDTRDTRFAGITALETVMADGWTFVLAGGADDGVSLFLLLPDGRLQHLDTLADDHGTSLANVSDIAAAVVGDELQVFVSSQAEAGISQFVLSLAGMGKLRTGSTGGDVLTGTAGRDVLWGAAGDDRLTGGDGADILIDGTGRDTMTGGAGADIFALSADGEVDTVADFDPAQDRLDLSRVEALRDASSITIESTATGAILTFGDETIVLRSHHGGTLRIDAILATIDIGAASRGPLGNVTPLPGVEPPQVKPPEPEPEPEPPLGDTLTGTDLGELLAGSDGDDMLIGNGGNDTLDGGRGDDTLIGGPGADRLIGGEGFDSVDYLGSRKPLKFDLLDPSFNAGDAAGDLFFDVEAFRGGLRDDDLRGDDRDNLINGSWGNDFIMGRGGDDILIGSRGRDTLRGGEGNDVLNGGEDDDVLMGEDGDDRLVGEDGDDLLDGGDGRNKLIGYGGNDTILDGADDSTLFGGVGGDLLSGGAGSDRLLGYHGDDTLMGGAGRDTIAGNDGNDLLTGGDDRDIFVFQAGSGRDTITDFTPRHDRLFIDDALVDGLTDPTEIIARYAHVAGGQVTFDFGDGNSVTLQGIGSLHHLDHGMLVV